MHHSTKLRHKSRGIVMHGVKEYDEPTRRRRAPSLTGHCPRMENKKNSTVIIGARSHSSILLGKRDIPTRHCENEFDSSQLVIIKNNNSLGTRQANRELRNQRSQCAKCTIEVNVTLASRVAARAVVTALAAILTAFVCNKLRKIILDI